jgi:hypothetical protein
MNVVVSYPVRVVKFQVYIAKDSATIGLEGVEGRALTSTPDEKNLRRVGEFAYLDLMSEVEDFTTRGGFLYMRRPLTVPAGTLKLLQHVKPIFLHQDGTLSTTLDPYVEPLPA